MHSLLSQLPSLLPCLECTPQPVISAADEADCIGEFGEAVVHLGVLHLAAAPLRNSRIFHVILPGCGLWDCSYFRCRTPSANTGAAFHTTPGAHFLNRFVPPEHGISYFNLNKGNLR
jgi:hypothetical protein